MLLCNNKAHVNSDLYHIILYYISEVVSEDTKLLRANVFEHAHAHATPADGNRFQSKEKLRTSYEAFIAIRGSDRKQN